MMQQDCAGIGQDSRRALLGICGWLPVENSHQCEDEGIGKESDDRRNGIARRKKHPDYRLMSNSHPGWASGCPL